MTEPAKLTLAVCTWRRGTRLSRLLKSIADAAPPPVPWEVLVVDGDETGATRALTAPFSDRLPLRYVLEPSPGSSAARNRALAEAGADLVVFVDDDVTVTRTFLTSYAEAALVEPDVAFFGGPVELRFERSEPAWVHDPRIFDGMFGRLHVDPDHGAITPQRMPQSANFAVRRSRVSGQRFDAAIGTQRALRINADETLFLKRLLGAGAAGRWLPDALVHRWIAPERTTMVHVARHLMAGRRARTTIRACDDDAVAPAVVLGQSPGASVLRVQQAVGSVVLGRPSWFGWLRRVSSALGARGPRGAMDFVVGHPRSGTNLLAHLLNASGTHVAEHEYLTERTLLGTLVEAATEHYEGDLPSEDVEALLRNADLDPRIRIDSSWKNVWILGPLMKLYPDARYLHVTRDPRENVIACHNLDYYGTVGWRPDLDGYPMARWLRSMPSIPRPGWDQLSAFEKNCEFWVETHRLILDTLATHPDRYRMIRLEDLRDDDATLGVYRFFGLPTPPPGALRHVLGTPVNSKPLDLHLVAQHKTDMLPRFSACPPEIQSTLRRICGPMAERLGYHIDG